MVVVIAMAVALWLLNTSLFASPERDIKVLAHRGVTQTTSVALDNDDCFASVIDLPRHDYVENTVPSMRAAFELGADGVELDVHPTTDGEFVVFHDWPLDCATNGTGTTREQTSTYIRSLDPAYNYTADGGSTYPLRGKWTGQIPLLSEVLTAFPDQVLFLNVKSDDPAEGDALARYLNERGQATGRIMVYGGQAPVERLREAAPAVRSLSSDATVRDLATYGLVGWTGYVPGSLRDSVLTVPLEYARFVWGWPSRFSDRMAEAGTAVVLIKSTGRADRYFDSVGDLAQIPDGFRGYIMTDEVETIVTALRQTSGG